jgi:hypothetical protein
MLVGCNGCDGSDSCDGCNGCNGREVVMDCKFCEVPVELCGTAALWDGGAPAWKAPAPVAMIALTRNSISSYSGNGVVCQRLESGCACYNCHNYVSVKVSGVRTDTYTSKRWSQTSWVAVTSFKPSSHPKPQATDRVNL